MFRESATIISAASEVGSYAKPLQTVDPNSYNEEISRSADTDTVCGFSSQHS
jgi:hypothetical protein